MSGERNFHIALIISALFHLTLLFSLSAFNLLPARRILKEVEVNYLKIKSLNLDSKAKPSRKDLDKVTLNQPLILSSQDKIPDKINRFRENDSLLTQSNTFQKPNVKKDGLVFTGSIKLSAVELGSMDRLSKNPVYLTYSNFLRETIRRCLYNRFSRLTDSGVVYLKFAINSGGALVSYRIIDAKTNASDKLKQITIDGLRDASPFPVFPRELNSPVETFTVMVHFSVQNKD